MYVHSIYSSFRVYHCGTTHSVTLKIGAVLPASELSSDSLPTSTKLDGTSDICVVLGPKLIRCANFNFTSALVILQVLSLPQS